MPAKKKVKPDEEPVQTEMGSTPEMAEITIETPDHPPDTGLLQTETESENESASLQEILQISPQTEMKSEDDPAAGLAFAPGETDLSPFPQTDSKSDAEAAEGLGYETPPGEMPSADRTESEIEPAAEETMEGETGEPHASEPGDPAAPQTEPETPRATRRRRRTESDNSQSDTEPTAQPAAMTPRRRTRASLNVISIDERRTVETEEDKARSDLIDLMESQKSGRILSGTVQGVENTSDTPPDSIAVIYHGDIKVIIPSAEMVERPADFRGRRPEDVMHYLMTRRLGAEVDYIVKGVDMEAGVAVASRLEAMRAKRRQFYFGTDRDGNYIMHSGVCAEARVVSVIRTGIFIDLCGLEIFIPLRELSYQRMMDAGTQYRAGQRILVKVLEVDRRDRQNVRASASVKQLSENPYDKALQRYSIGDSYVGTVSLVDTTGVFVALDSGIDILCRYPRHGRPPRGAQVTVRVMGINYDANRIWGVITHIAAAR